MIEKGKSLLLFLLVLLSLLQSYFLAYSMPNMDPKVKTELDYVKAEPLGAETTLDKLIFPEQMVLHMGNDKHTVFYPSTQPYYKLILDKLRVREFQGFQQDPIDVVNWDQVRRRDEGVELRFGRAVPFQLLQQVFKIDGDFLFSRDSINRIWIFSSKDRDEVRTFFFSSDGRNVYESQRADITGGDVKGYVGFGQYWDPYSSIDGKVYTPDKPVTRFKQMQVNFSRYTTEQMQDNLFFDPGTTRTIQDRKNGPQFYTDGKRGLKVEQNGGWMSYTDAVASTTGDNDLMDNVSAAVDFVNQHGGWNGRHQLVREIVPENGSGIRFQQYYKDAPVVSGNSITFGYMQLTLQQGDVASYERSLIVLGNEETNKKSRMLPGGEQLRMLLRQVETSTAKVEALFPAYKPSLNKDVLTFHPVWAARMTTGETVVISDSAPPPVVRQAP
ncbi:hypothetical protein SD71_08520 [Cohnella kolymensis]|uniref:Regulatory protein YycH domain-containing protein n=1 Tax=Cohnella kolymensis TaxID=1590652 RepID=A0ABR5A5K0_9BACL|nr:two-component system activity regulator YycH [Cohnella kolymensis]KIL36304.1 hypothetical protein SD71_08520 [Cohnella kolymensis]